MRLPSPDDGSLDPLLGAASRVLSGALGREVRLGDAELLSEPDRRNVLLRCRNLSGGDPAAVIVKRVAAETYDHADAASFHVKRFFSDWTGAEFLSALPGAPHHGPRFYGGDRELGFVVLEDLGDPPSLVQPLLDGAAASAERALLGLAVRLGRLHADTAGRAADFGGRFRALNPDAVPFSLDAAELRQHHGQIEGVLEGLGVRLASGYERDLESVIAAVASPGPFSAYIHADPCPDNVLLTPGGVRLIDFEFGHFEHALLDGAYGRMMFPTCWCANRLPASVVSAMESAYRAELVRGCREAEDDGIFESELVKACGMWLVRTLVFHLPEAMDADREWGIATIRPRLLARTEAFVATAEAFDHLPAMRATASALLEALRRRWPDADSLPLYPAFRAVDTASGTHLSAEAPGAGDSH